MPLSSAQPFQIIWMPMQSNMKAIIRIITSVPMVPSRTMTVTAFLKTRYSTSDTSSAPPADISTPSAYLIGSVGICAPSAIDAAMVPTSIIHGWDDELIPAGDVINWAAMRRASLLLVDDGHRLSENVDTSAEAFAALLAKL